VSWGRQGKNAFIIVFCYDLKSIMDTGDLDRINWAGLSGEDLRAVSIRLGAMLSSKEKAELDVVFMGSVLLFRAKELSWKVNEEILGPLAEWMRDPEVLLRHKFSDEEALPALFLKRDYGDRSLQVARLRLYWEHVRRKRQFLAELASLGSRGCGIVDEASGAWGVEEFLEPFCSVGLDERRLREEFSCALESAGALRVPYRELLAAEVSCLNGPAELDSLVSYAVNDRLGVVGRLSAALQLDKEGIVELAQAEPFGRIIVEKRGILGASVRLKDRGGGVKVVDVGCLDCQERADLVGKVVRGDVLCG